MTQSLEVSVGQYSDRGQKPVNQDFHGMLTPSEPILSSKGAVIALADGISSSEVSQIASETAVKSFIEDYYATSEAWTVKNSARRVLGAINSWLYAQSRNSPHRYDLNRGYVCTFCALIIKSTTAHLFHAGDSRICYLTGNRLESLTEEHRLWLGPDKTYLNRALGMRELLEIDYKSYTVECGDTLVLMTDGVYEHIEAVNITAAIHEHANDLDQAARCIVNTALANGSDDNLTIQIIRVNNLPVQNINELNRQAVELPFPPELRQRCVLDGYEVVRELHHSHRSHVYLAIDQSNGQKVALKTPSVELRNDPDYLERFLMEEWIARRVDNLHLIKPVAQKRKRSALYIVSEYIEGQTLEQWIHDNPEPGMEEVRRIIEQIASGLRALHRQEMLHQDLRPGNVMIDHNGTVKLIDFGSVKVAGVAEISRENTFQHILGSTQYTAPEYFIGELGDRRSDLFSLGIITYQMLCGYLPYGTDVAKVTNRVAQLQLRYRPALRDQQPIPAWIDGALRKAVQPLPKNRYNMMSEFICDLRHPNPAFVNRQAAPLLERNPLLFWKGVSLLLLLIIMFLITT